MLLMGVFLVILAGGRFVTPTAAFLAPLFLLMFTRNSAVKTGIGVLFTLLFLSLLVRLHGYVQLPKPALWAFAGALALLETLPFLLDKLLHNKLSTFLKPFVLPTAMVAVGFVFTVLLPAGTIAGSAYTQAGNVELMQLAALTGIHGITFMAFWFASVMAFLWESGFAWRRCQIQFLPLAIALMLVFVSGGFRNIFNEHEASTVRVAGVVGHRAGLHKALELSGGANDDGSSVLISTYHDQLFERSLREAVAGAKIISWAEGDGLVFATDLGNLKDRASLFADTNNVYLVATVAVLPDTPDSKVQQKLLVFDPQGAMPVEYVLSRPLPGSNTVRGDGQLPQLDTPYGTLGFALGFDLDSPRLLRQLSGVDIIIAPASDWKTIARPHANMATFRGIENGASLFRPANNGVSLASDPHGRILAMVDHHATVPHTIIAELPIRVRFSFFLFPFSFFLSPFSFLLAMQFPNYLTGRRCDLSLDKIVSYHCRIFLGSGIIDLPSL